MKIRFVVIPLWFLIFFSCTDQGTEPATFQSGTVQFVEVEGGSWGIFADNGEHYRVPNLSPQFQKVGLRVEFFGIPNDNPSIYMWGRGIDLFWIRAIK